MIPGNSISNLGGEIKSAHDQRLVSVVAGAERDKLRAAADFALPILYGVNLGGDVTSLYPAQATAQQDATIAQPQETPAELTQQDDTSSDDPVTRAQAAVREALAQQGDSPAMEL